MPAVELARRDGVELAAEGVWPISTGVWTAKAEDFQHAVEALECPAIRRPVLKIGHTDGRFTPGDGEPAIGWVDKMRVSDGKLVGDYVGVPAWLNDVMASAYPDRSIEGRYDYVCQLGHKHPFVVTAVSLLGVTPPGVGTLQSLQDVAGLFGVAASANDQDCRTIVAFISASAQVEAPNLGSTVGIIASELDDSDVDVILGAIVDDDGDDDELVEAAGNPDALHDYWTKGKGLAKWIGKKHRWTALYKHLRKYIKNPEYAKRTAAEWFHEVLGFWPGSKENKPVKASPSGIRESDPGDDSDDRESALRDLIDGLSDDDMEKLVALAEEYLAEDSDEVAAAAGSKFKRLAAELASRGVRDPEGLAAWIGRKKYGRAKFAEMAKRGRRNVNAAADVDPSAAEPKSEKPNQEEGDAMSLSEIRSRLGLAEDADETAMLAAVDALKAKAETPAVPAEPSPEQVAAAAAVAAERDGLAKQVDLLDQQVKAMSAQLSEANAAQAATVKASVLDTAQADGKFTPADREQWEADYDAAPAAVTRVLASIAAGTAVPVKPAGKSGSTEPSERDVDAEFAKLFPPTAQEVAK